MGDAASQMGCKQAVSGYTNFPPGKDSVAAFKRGFEAAGGKVESENISIPAGQFCYARDLDGNSIGLFEYKT